MNINLTNEEIQLILSSLNLLSDVPLKKSLVDKLSFEYSHPSVSIIGISNDDILSVQDLEEYAITYSAQELEEVAERMRKRLDLNYVFEILKDSIEESD